MKKITENQYWSMPTIERWEVFNSLQSELEALEGRKGFVIDWDEADSLEGATVCGWTPFAMYKDRNGLIRPGVALSNMIPRPIHPNVTRERTDLELVNLCFDLFGSWETVARAIVKEGSLKNLCTAAGISLTSE